MRFAAYAGTSMVLAAGVVIRALTERSNFYASAVYISQNNAALMILTNISLLAVSMTMLGLQKLFYGPLRPIEIEQLYEKAWFAVTETCLAMTIFREEVGGWFLVMFVSLLIGKVWGWIGEGRVEILEQQPPANPRLFHARLSVSLMISTLFDISMLHYSVKTVLLHARPNMMVMFAFEFAVLFVTSVSTALRYVISLQEAKIIESQIKDRRAQMRRDREQVQSAAQVADGTPAPEGGSTQPSAPTEDDIDSMDIDVPGWEEKGRWVFYLDLSTDFCKLVLYLTFFCVLCMFYGMPIHIIRDVALTIRSFHKRITDFVRYRQATRDMNARYPDATSEEVAREDVCIICREDMRPWPQHAAQGNQGEANAGDNAAPPMIDERLRPKKLPCGHILHFACLRSWLERQQNCPTCRRPVLVPNTAIRAQPQQAPNQPARALPHQNPPQGQAPGQPDGQQPPPAPNVYQFGPLRIAFGARHGAAGLPPQANNNAPNAQGQGAGPANTPRVRNPFGLTRQAPGTQTRTVANFSPLSTASQLNQTEQQLMREINGLRAQTDQLFLVRALQGELSRLRVAQANPSATDTVQNHTPNTYRMINPHPQSTQPLPSGQVFASSQPPQSMGFGHQNLPAGMTIPDGWSVLPLQRLPSGPSSTTNDSTLTPSQGTGADTSSAASVYGLQDLATDTAITGHSSSIPLGGVGEAAGSESIVDPGPSQATSDVSGTHTGTAYPAQEVPEHVSSTNDLSTAKIPHWGSSSSAADGDSNRESQTVDKAKAPGLHNGHAVSGESSNTQPAAAGSSQGKDKGKGRATTVEDLGDDVD